MLPPAWTIALSQGIKRAEIENDKLSKANDAEKKKIAQSAGYGSSGVKKMTDFIAKLMKANRSYV
jgi:hypothetical protein